MWIFTRLKSRGVLHSNIHIPITSALICAIVAFLSACDYEYPLSGEIQNVDLSLEGEWKLDTGGIVLVQAQPDGYLILDLSTSEAKGGILFDQGTILKIGGRYFLQAHVVGTVRPSGSLQRKATKNPWMVREIERHGNRIRLRDTLTQPHKFSNAAEFRSWFVTETLRSRVSGGPLAVANKVGSLGNRDLAAIRKSDNSAKIIAGIAAVAAAIWAISSVASPSRAKTSTNTVKKWDPGTMCCDSQSHAPPTGSKFWQGHDLWCWTDYNEVMKNDEYKHPTYCQNSRGGYWQRNGLFDKCDGVEGWCD